jgi:hypothetical protein
MRILQYICYGSDRRYHLELTYSVLSAYRYLRVDPSDIRIVLVADEQNLRPDLPVENHLVPADLLRQWQMDGTYHQAMQGSSLRHIVRHYDAPAILIDTDTVLRGHPKLLFERIGPGATLMNVREGRVRDLREWPEIAQIAAALGGRAADLPLTPDTVMYNCGVMGVTPRDVALVDRVIEATEAMRVHSRLFTCNQIAASMVFANLSRLSTCEDLIRHYWDGPRQYYHYQIHRMFPEVRSGGGIANPDTPLPPLDDLPPPDFRHRLLGRLKRAQRSAPSAYAHAHACASSALATQSRDAEMANVWAITAVDVLAYGLPSGPRANPQDFRAFSPAELDAHAWLKTDTRKRWKQYWSGEIGPPVA